VELPGLYIVIPAYNEGAAVGHFFTNLLDEVEKQALKATLVLVDDGSTDESRPFLTEVEQRKDVVLLRHDKNLGVARALETGIRWVLEKGDLKRILVVLEADGTNDIKILSKLCDKIDDGFDVAIGSRHLSGGGAKGLPLIRRSMSAVGNFALRWAIGYPGVCDYTIFYRAYRLSIINEIAKSSNGCLFNEKGFAANAELLLKIASSGARVTEVPHLYNYNLKQSTSKMDMGNTIRGYLNLIYRFHNSMRKTIPAENCQD